MGALDQILTLDVSHLEVLVSGMTEAALDAVPVRNRVRVGERWTLEIDERRLGETVQAVEAAGGRVLSQGEFVPGEPYLFATDLDGYEFEIWFELPTPVDPPRPPARKSKPRRR